MKSKKVSESTTIMTQAVLPNDTNLLGNLFGGQLLSWMDLASSITAKRHSEGIAVTASVNNVSFNAPIPLASVVTLEANITRAFSTSMEIMVDVWVENKSGQEKRQVNNATYIFAAVDGNGKKRAIPEIIPETEIQKKRYNEAAFRKEMALIFAGKLSMKDAENFCNHFK